MTTTLLSFRVDDDQVERVDQWARRLQVDLRESPRDALGAS